jgi:glycosyltransferase involved in cell wall biosynthesis
LIPDAAITRRPTFSILIASHNAEATIGETIESLLAQDAGEWEAIVVDDGSTDASFDVATQLASSDPRVRVLRQENKGAGSARNLAASAAKGEWLLPLDADDLLEPAALGRLAAFIQEHPDAEIYSVGVTLLHPDGRRTPWSVSAAHPKVESFSLEQLVAQNLMTVSTAIAPTLFAQLGGFRDVFMEDWDLWLRALAAGGRHLHCPEPLFVYRVSANSKNADVRARSEATARIMADLAGDGRVSEPIRKQAQLRSQYFAALALRSELERCLARGDCRGARSRYWRARDAYIGRVKWLAGAVVMLVSPRLFARLFVRSSIEQTNVV